MTGDNVSNEELELSETDAEGVSGGRTINPPIVDAPGSPDSDAGQGSGGPDAGSGIAATYANVKRSLRRPFMGP